MAWNDDGSRLALTTCGVVGDDLNDDQGGACAAWALRRPEPTTERKMREREKEGANRIDRRRERIG